MKSNVARELNGSWFEYSIPDEHAAAAFWLLHYIHILASQDKDACPLPHLSQSNKIYCRARHQTPPFLCPYYILVSRLIKIAAGGFRCSLLIFTTRADASFYLLLCKWQVCKLFRRQVTKVLMAVLMHFDAKRLGLCRSSQAPFSFLTLSSSEKALFSLA